MAARSPNRNNAYAGYYARFGNQQPNGPHGFAPHPGAAGAPPPPPRVAVPGGGGRPQTLLPTVGGLGDAYHPTNEEEGGVESSSEDEETKQRNLEKAKNAKKKETEAEAKLMQDELNWYKYYAEFAVHKAESGTSHVSIGREASDAARQLSKWVNAQRRQYRLYMYHQQHQQQEPPVAGSSSRSVLTEKQIHLLQKVGFDFKYNPNANGPNGASPNPPAKKKSWEEWLELLHQYAKENDGIADVPQKHPGGLGLFVAHQRSQYRLWTSGDPKSKLTPEKVAQLEAAGMVFRSHRYRPQTASWDDRWEELKVYKETHNGTTWIPVNKTKKKQEDGTGESIEQQQEEANLKPLAKWCDRQRQNYRALMAGKPSCMTKERINKLEELDFEWNRADSIAAARLKREADGDGTTTPTPKKRARKSLPPGSVSNPQKWLNQLEQLKEYKKVNGNCRIKSSKRKGDDYDSLAKWCDHQRQQYRLRKENKKSSMTEERIQQLEELGFEWVLAAAKSDIDFSRPPPPLAKPRKPTEKAEKLWNSHWEELKEFRKEYNHTRVTKKFKGKDGKEKYGKLGKWVEHQRTNMRLRYEGKQSPMTDERIAKLKELDFEWSVMAKPNKATPTTPTNTAMV